MISQRKKNGNDIKELKPFDRWIMHHADEYCIVEIGTDYGIAQFDYIVRNGTSVNEDDILYD